MTLRSRPSEPRMDVQHDGAILDSAADGANLVHGPGQRHGPSAADATKRRAQPCDTAARRRAKQSTRAFRCRSRMPPDRPLCTMPNRLMNHWNLVRYPTGCGSCRQTTHHPRPTRPRLSWPPARRPLLATCAQLLPYRRAPGLDTALLPRSSCTRALTTDPWRRTGCPCNGPR